MCVRSARAVCAFAYGCLGDPVRLRVSHGAVSGSFARVCGGVCLAFVVVVSWAFWLVRSALALCLGCVWRSDERVPPSVACACAAFLARPSAVSLVLVPLCVSSLRRLCCCGCSCLALARSSRFARAACTPPALVGTWVWRLRFAWCVMRVRALGSRGLCVCVRVFGRPCPFARVARCGLG